MKLMPYFFEFSILSIKIRLTVTLFMIFSSQANAYDNYKPYMSLEKVITTLTVKADGTYDEIYDYTARIETEQGANDFGQETISYSSSYETLKILEAYIIQPNGIRVDVSQKAISDKSDAIDGGAASFSDTRHKLIIYPNVQVGSRLHYKIKRTRHTALFTGHFFYSDSFSPHFRSKYEEINLIVSKKLPLKFDIVGMQGGQLADFNGQHRYRYTFKQKSALAPESLMVNKADFVPHFYVSSFTDQVAFGRAYQANALPMTKVTPAIQKISDEVTLNLVDQKSQIKALYYWVAKNIRYVSISLGNGGVVPHNAEDILNNRYGDCKDHVALLEALLKAKGIESSPALINMGEAYKLPKVAVLRPLNHVITYIPSLDLFLDSTARFAPFGALPTADMDKPVILTVLNKLGRTPFGKSSDHTITNKSKLTLLKNGDIKGTSEISAIGWYENDLRDSRFNELYNTDQEILTNRLSAFNENGIGKIKTTDAQDFTKLYKEETSFILDAQSNIPGPTGLKVPVGPMQISMSILNKPLAKYNFPFTCYTRTMRDEYTITFPDNLQIKSIPTNVNYKEDANTYLSRYILNGKALNVSRELKTERKSMVCNQLDNNKNHNLFKVMQRDFRSQVIYE